MTKHSDHTTMTANDTQIGGSHYKDLGDFQPWDVLRHWLTPEEYRGWQKGTAIVYLARERAKGGDQDIAKAGHHIQKLVEVLAETAAVEQAITVREPVPQQRWEPGSGWITWHGDLSSPVDKEWVSTCYAMVRVQFRNGLEVDGMVCNFRWEHSAAPGDIVAYQFLKPV